MINRIKFQQPIVIFPLIFAYFMLINLYLRNINLVSINEVLIPGIIILILYAVIWVVANRFLKNRAKTAIITSTFFILFFSFGHFLSASTDLLLRMTGIDLRPFFFNNISWKMAVLLIIWIGIFSLFLYFIIRIKSDFRIITQFMNVASITLLVLMVYQATKQTLITRNFTRQDLGENYKVASKSSLTAQDQSKQGKNALPDIYYIIVDGYGSAEVLEKYYDFDNHQFISFLADRDFYIPENSHSNYMITVLSLSSSLNMKYLDYVAENMGLSSKNPLPLVQLIHSNELMGFLKERGYEIISFETGFGATELTSAEKYYSSGKTLTAFQSELISLTPLQIWLNNFLYETQRDRISYIFYKLPDAADPDQPSFVFAHITSPHPPFIFGPNGEKDNPDMIYSPADANTYTDIGGKGEYKIRYRNQVVYLNKRLEKTIDEILDNPNSNPIIIIQGDHGPGSELNWESVEDSNVEERMGILNAYYFPDQDYSNLYSSITPINSFRIVLDQYLGTNLGLLEDRSYFSLMSKPYNFIDVMEEMNQNK